MEAMLIILFVIAVIFLYGNLAGWVVHATLHTKRFKKLSADHNRHHTLYTPSDFESVGVYRDAGSARSTLVFVPIITTAIGLLCIPLWFMFQVWWIYPIILAVGAFVGWLNDHMHYAFHIKDHRYNKYSYFRKLKQLHLIHHTEPKFNHGIFWFGIDRLFGTYRDGSL